MSKILTPAPTAKSEDANESPMSEVQLFAIAVNHGATETFHEVDHHLAELDRAESLHEAGDVSKAKQAAAKNDQRGVALVAAVCETRKELRTLQAATVARIQQEIERLEAARATLEGWVMEEPSGPMLDLCLDILIDLDARGIPDGDRDVSELPHDAAEISIRDQASLFGKSRHFFETFREILQPA